MTKFVIGAGNFLGLLLNIKLAGSALKFE